MLLHSCSVVSDSATPWTVARQVPLSMGFLRQQYWSGLPSSSPGDLSDRGNELVSPAWQADSWLLSLLGTSLSLYWFSNGITGGEQGEKRFLLLLGIGGRVWVQTYKIPTWRWKNPFNGFAVMNGSCLLEQIIQLMVVNGYRLPPSTQFNLDKRLLRELGRTFCQPFSDLSLSLWKTDIRALKNAFTKRSEWVLNKGERKK